MPAAQDLNERIARRTELGAQAGLEFVPAGVLLFVFGLGELGWRLGAWFLPTLGATLAAATVGTVAAFHWRRRRYGRVKARWDHRVTVLVAALAIGHVLISLADGGWGGRLGEPVYLPGITFGLLLAGLSLSSPYALAQHLAFGLLVVVGSAVPLGMLVDMPVPPARADAFGAHPHPLAVLAPLLMPTWLIVTGIIGHVRLSRALARPVLRAGQDDQST